jgi:hypothetical protein
MKLNKKTFRKWAVKILALLIVLTMIFTGFIVMLSN